MNAHSTKNPLTANSTNHVISRPKIVFGSTSRMNRFWRFRNILLNLKCLKQKKNLLGHGEYGASSVPSPQWLMPSHIKSDEIQNSVDLHLNSLQEWSEIQEIFVHKFTSQAIECKNVLSLLIFLMAVRINLKPFESVPQPSQMYLSVKKLLWVIMFPTDCFVFRQDMSICEEMRKNKKWNI